MEMGSHFYRSYLFLILLLGFTLQVSSQKIESNLIYQFSTEQGLSNNVIYSVLQDRKGFIWIATEEGLNKFDGKKFTHFAVNKGRYSLSHNRTQTMLLAPDGNIWTGTSDGLNIYDYKTDSIIKVRNNTAPLKLVYNDITFLSLSTDRSRIWIGTYGNGVNYFDWDKKQFNALSLPKIPDIAAPLNVMSILEDDNNRLWIGTQQNGLYRYDRAENSLKVYELPEGGRYIRSIYQDSFRRIWIGTSKGCYIYNETSDHLEPITYPEGLTGNSIGVIKEDLNGKIWIGTELFLMNFSVRSFSMNEKFDYQLFKQGESPSKLSCASINSLFADQDNNIWIGTAWGGVNMLKGTATKFKLFKHDPESRNSLPNSPLVTIAPDRKGNLFVATMGTGEFGLCKLNLVSSDVNALEVDRKLPGYIYQSMLYDTNNSLWLGTYNKGLIRLDPSGSGFKQYTYDHSNPNSLPDNDVRCIFEGKNKAVWIGTSNGLAKFDQKSQILTRVNLTGNRNIAIRSINETSNGLLWIGTYGGGLMTYNPVDEKVDFSPSDLSPHIISQILSHGDSLWIATQGEGLYLYVPQTKAHVIYNDLSGLESNYVSSIVRDQSGNIWMGQSKGISKLNIKTQEIENFSSGDGIQSREFSERGAVAMPNGLIAFAGFGGLNVFNPLNVTKNDKCPPVIFTRLLVFNQVVTPSGDSRKYSPLTENITLADQIELKYEQSVFTIEFMGINYTANQKIQYAFFLEGSDQKWNQVGNQNSVTFRNLQPGKYRFKVKASSPDAVWSDTNIASVDIVVRPPLWASGWAYFLYVSLIVAILYFAWLFINIRINEANRLKIERAKREKEEELHQEKLQFFTNISHEFRTPLTLIIGPLEKMQYDELNEEKKSHFKLMLRNANRLLSMVNQLLDFRKTEKGQMKLKVQNSDIIQCIKEIIISFEDLKKQKNIHLKFSYPEDVLMAWFDTEFLNKSLINLLSNAFKFTPDGGSISISTMVTKDVLGNKELVISIVDNGKGIQPKDIHSIFDRFYQGKVHSNMQQGSGIGLHLVKNLIELHHGTIEAESTPNVETTFKITLPIEKSAYLKDEFMEETEITSDQTNDKLDIENDDNTDEISAMGSPKNEHKKRILIVEDNADIRNYIRSILGSQFTLEEAENGAIGLEIVTLHDYDLIISDLMMPEMDGLEMCKRIKSSVETSHIPIILLTAKSDIENRIEGLSIGADSYITKPFHPEHLVTRVNKLIELREMLKERYSRKISLVEMHKPEIKSDSPDEIFLQKTISVILVKMSETEFNGDRLASELSISRMGLHRKVKALTGQSTGELIRNIRLKKACELLSIPGKNISEVCYDVGFNSPSYFTTCFVDTYEMTPSEYARRVKTQ
ncbi:MAG TPA: two-component regulator propeller domain-containing protein [Prolixibacteraceae bacterium]|jgi:signal transduction histidine kinase/ligand-binding sensor domain-containing protein/CheY-like chemotaxis protein